MTTKGVTTSRKEILHLCNEPLTAFVVQDRAQLFGILIGVSKTLFGVNPDSFPADFMNIVFKAITERFIGIRLNDVKEAFNVAEIEKKEYTSLTRDELIEPIKKYWERKQKLVHAVREAESTELIEREKREKEASFLMESRKILSESIQAGEYLGDHFNAFAIIDTIADQIPEEIKKPLWEESKRDLDKQKTNTFFNIENPINAKRIYAYKLMQYYCSKE